MKIHIKIFLFTTFTTCDNQRIHKNYTVNPYFQISEWIL